MSYFKALLLILMLTVAPLSASAATVTLESMDFDADSRFIDFGAVEVGSSVPVSFTIETSVSGLELIVDTTTIFDSDGGNFELSQISNDCENTSGGECLFELALAPKEISPLLTGSLTLVFVFQSLTVGDPLTEVVELDFSGSGISADATVPAPLAAWLFLTGIALMRINRRKEH